MQAMLTFTNPTTGKEYQGGNITRLQDCCDSNPAYITGAFATFRQWLSVGRVVRKGEKVAARLVACGSDTLAPVKGEPVGTVAHKRGFLKSFGVFALEQTTTLETTDNSASIAETLEVEPVDAPEAGKQYSLATLAKEGTWAKSEVAPVSRLNLGTLRDKAARFMRQAEACHADRQTNTVKRLAQAMHKRMEGDRLKRQALILEALCSAVEAKTWTIGDMSTMEAVSTSYEAALFKCAYVNNGYHSYNVEGTTPQNASPIHDALRALLNPAAVQAEAVKSAQIQAEATLRQCDCPGFFPTPPSVIAVMLEQAGNLHGKKVLEPSCGKGDIVKAAMSAGADVVGFEIVTRLANYCHDYVSKSVFCDDFMLSHVDRSYDAVLMNPPFEKDAAPKHVLHALSWLKPGGRLVAVMPSNWSSKSSADALMRTIDDRGFSTMDMELGTGAFSGADAFRQTGVNVCLLIVNA